MQRDGEVWAWIGHMMDVAGRGERGYRTCGIATSPHRQQCWSVGCLDLAVLHLVFLPLMYTHDTPRDVVMNWGRLAWEPHQCDDRELVIGVNIQDMLAVVGNASYTLVWCQQCWVSQKGLECSGHPCSCLG